MSHLLRGRYEESCRAAYKSVQTNPAHSITYVQLAAALAKLGRLDEARAAAARVLELHPAFRYSRQFSGANCASALAEALGSALRSRRQTWIYFPADRRSVGQRNPPPKSSKRRLLLRPPIHQVAT